MVKRKRKVKLKKNAEVSWNTEYKSEAYKYTIKMIAMIMCE